MWAAGKHAEELAFSGPPSVSTCISSFVIDACCSCVLEQPILIKAAQGILAVSAHAALLGERCNNSCSLLGGVSFNFPLFTPFLQQLW